MEQQIQGEEAKSRSVPKTTLLEMFTGKNLETPESQGGKKGSMGLLLVFFFPPSSFYSKVFLHMTQTSLNFPKLQSLLMAQPQSGREDVKRGKEKKKKTVCKPVKYCVVVAHRNGTDLCCF